MDDCLYHCSGEGLIMDCVPGSSADSNTVIFKSLKEINLDRE